MIVTSSYRVLENGHVEIYLNRHGRGSFSSSYFEAEKMYGRWNGYYFETNCFEFEYNTLFKNIEINGNGVLSNNGRTLKIIIENPPEMFNLKTNGFEKGYYTGITEAEESRGSVLLYVSEVEGIDALVILRNDESWGLSNYVLGYVFYENSIVGYAPGVKFENIISEDFEYGVGNCSYMTGYPYYEKGGYVFGQILHTGNGLPSGKLTLAFQSGGSQVIYKDFMNDGGSISTDANSEYDIDWSRHYFTGKLLSSDYSKIASPMAPLSTSRI